MSIEAITTDRLTLRTPALSDAADVMEIMRDIDVVSWPLNAPHTLADTDARA